MNKCNAILEINTRNLLYNFKALSQISSKSICAATIKANAYGVGVIKIIELLSKNKCNHFFVATLDEALIARDKNKKINIYILNGLENKDSSIFIKNNLIPILNSIKELKLFIKNKNFKKKTKYGLHIDTGLNRLGIPINELSELKKLRLRVTILISHLASADEEINKYNKIQNRKFINTFKFFEKIKYKSLCNSMGILLGKSYHYDMVRPGISIYGGHFDTEMKSIVKPVVTLKGKVLQIKEIKENEYIGYNQTFKTNRKIKVAIVGIGYGDGISRSLSNNGKVFYKNNIYNIVGRVSMDTITIDITKKYKIIKEGIYLDIFNDKYGIDIFAKKNNTICDEILTSISDRVKRIYI